jgi:predicted NBD/HSP70 family sugar kinase
MPADPVESPGGPNRNVLLRELRLRAPVSRVELSKSTGISKPAVTRGVSGLMEEGLVVEAELGRAGSTGGRRPRLLELNPAAAAGLGCVIKVGQLVGCVAGFDGGIEHTERVSFDPLAHPETVVDQVAELIESLHARNTPGRPVVGVGASVPGLVDDVGKVLTTPHMPGWRDFPLAEVLVERLGLPTYLDNESRVQAIAEGWFGLGRGVDNFVCLEAGVGISAGIVINGELWRGVHSLAGEIGHSSTSGNGDRCYCDNRGCWEMMASTSHLLNSVKTSSIARSDEALYQDAELTIESVISAADGGDEVALREIGQHADALASGICNLVLAYDPERIILHGESILLGERLVQMVRERVADRFRLWLDYEAPIMISELGTDAGLAGTAGLALHGAWGLRDPTARMGSPLAR